MDTCVLSYSTSQTDVVKDNRAVRHTNELHRRLSRYPSTALSDLIPVATAALKASSEAAAAEQEQEATDNTSRSSSSFARALTKVKLQIQSRRLKEKYLGHEWIRLALGLPVDEKIINSNQPRGNGDHLVVVKKCLEGRTGEIATWYEWKFDKSKFTVEEVESKVDRLRKKRLQIQQEQQEEQQQQQQLQLQQQSKNQVAATAR